MAAGAAVASLWLLLAAGLSGAEISGVDVGVPLTESTTSSTTTSAPTTATTDATTSATAGSATPTDEVRVLSHEPASGQGSPAQPAGEEAPEGPASPAATLHGDPVTFLLAAGIVAVVGLILVVVLFRRTRRV